VQRILLNSLIVRNIDQPRLFVILFEFIITVIRQTNDFKNN
jgi:hypothetical protein